MSRICPQCGREYFGQTAKCIHCKCELVEKTTASSPLPRQAGRQTAAQINQQRMQQQREAQERAKQQRLEQLQAQQQALLAAQAQTKAAKNKKKQGIPMKTWKLVSGILSIIMFVFVTFQSCAAGAYNALSNNGEISGSAGVLVAIMLLAGGIVSIACRKGSKGGNIAIAILYGIGAFIGTMMAGSYTDLKVWSFWCLVCMLLAIISISGFRKANVITAVSLSCVWLLFAMFSGSGESSNSSNRTSSTTENRTESTRTNANSISSDSSQTYGIGQTWTVDGQWKLTVLSVKETLDRNEFSEKDPSAVYIVRYKYENIGYEDEDGLFDGLFISLDGCSIVDSSGKMGYSYPGSVDIYAQETPVGAYCEAESCIGVDNPGTFKIYLDKYDGNSNKQSAVFELKP